MDLRFPTMRYDHTMPLLEGRVDIPGWTIKPERTPAMVFGDVESLRTGDFGLCDLNTGYWPQAIEEGWELIGLPLFIKRKPVYQYLFVSNAIETPSDLEGKTIATNFYPTGITTLLQGLLTERHGVDASKLSWLANSGSDVFPRHDGPQTISIAAERKDPWDRLLGGEVDAIITDISDGEVWVDLESSPDVHRLFDYVAEDRKLYEETGMFTPMHLIVMSAKLDRENPGLARSIYDGFEEAKRLAYQDILNDRSGFGVLYLRERFVEQNNTWGDPWKYGVAANRDTVETFARYNAEQGVTKRQLALEELFAKGTLGT
jgi:4,5-dihydroxyphthalate decarboxylase